MHTTRIVSNKLAWLSWGSAFIAFSACNGAALLVTIMSLFGITFIINPHYQAATISLFSVLTAGLIFTLFRRHGNMGPLILSAIGSLFVIGTMYVSYNKIIESFGLFSLFAAAIWSWYLIKKQSNKNSAQQFTP